MSRRFRQYGLLACLSLAGAFTLSSCTGSGPWFSGHLDIESAELQSRLDQRFPIHQCKTPLLCLDLTHPQVALKEGDDRIALGVDVKVLLGMREHAGRVRFVGRPRYDAPQGALFLDDLEITTLEIEGLSPDHAEWVKSAGTPLARRALQSHPLYTVHDSTIKGAILKRTVSEVRVVDGQLRVTFSVTAP
jgi:hypothetical protein